MQNIAIFPNTDRDTDFSATRAVAEILHGFGKTVMLDSSLRGRADVDAEFDEKHELLAKCDLIVVLGGDGTILRVANDAAEFDIPIMGINLGHLGFLAQAESDETGVFSRLFAGEYTVRRSMMLEARIFSDGKQSGSYTALNDVILRGEQSKMISAEVEIGGTVTDRYLADGVIVATSTGSTAYSLSCGGPIVHPSLDCMILTPICPHTLKSRCIVVPPDSRVRVRIDAEYRSDAAVRTDGETVGTLGRGDYIEIVRSSRCASLINLNGKSFFDVIRNKLAD